MRVVLHVCCGVCAAGVVERLISEGHEVLGFFHNPNIHPAEEYHRRLEVARRVASELDFPLIETTYTPEEWFKETELLASEPEGGKRCEVCFRLRLTQAFLYMEEGGWDAFTTTLTISRHKSAEVINRVGREIGGDRFLVRDFKKQGGFQRSIELAKKWDLYRQNYCGCWYSMRTR
jgi:predicted adenine nucleotide alpha hydrolase (AANH) superfamily ATPase